MALPSIFIKPPTAISPMGGHGNPPIRTLVQMDLVNGGRGDRVWVTHLVSHPLGSGETYLALEQAFQVPPFTQIDGQPTVISGDFEDVPQTEINADWKRSLFHYATSGGISGCLYPSSEVVTHASPIYAPGRGFMTLASFVSTEARDDAMVSLSYGNPAPADWTEFSSFAAYCDREITVTMGNPPMKLSTSVFLSLGVTIPQARVGAREVVPIATPPMDLQINGESAETTVLGAGTTPVLSWRSSGVPPSSYSVRVRGYDANIVFTSTRARFSTEETSVTIPPGILELGGVYVFEITTFSELPYPDSENEFDIAWGSANATTAFVLP